MAPSSAPAAPLPVVALVGRPNTGKSTLFNRLTRSRRAVVAPEPGVTRDRNMAVADYEQQRFLVVDTGGFEADEHEELQQAVRDQSLLAAREADVIVAVLDGRAGVNPLDRLLLNQLRCIAKPLLVAVNKIDTPKQEHLESDFYALGVATLYPISAEHGRNVDDLVAAIVGELPSGEPLEGPTPEAALAIIGRPNVGKSSLLNRLVGYERTLVSPMPGTTRDAIDTTVVHAGRSFVIVDTAGIRRRSRVDSLVERASVVRAFRALERAEIALLVTDASEGITEQDARLANHAWERGRALVLVINKSDLMPRGRRAQLAFSRRVEEQFPSLALVTKVYVSARSGYGIDALWAAIEAALASHRTRIPTPKLNQTLMRAVQQQAPPMVKGRRPRFLYATQTGTAPPTVTIFTSRPGAVQAAYERYLVHQLRTAFGCVGTPIRLRFRARQRRAGVVADER